MVPATITQPSTTTAREYPIRVSKSEPELIWTRGMIVKLANALLKGNL